MKNVTAYRVRAGTHTSLYYTPHHAEQFARAMRLHGLPVKIDTLRLPDDPLTKLTVRRAQS